ncbi:Predicted gene 7073 [Apodemus speciosus]|uniref:Predicted gene 7073 n=1 Tax=Apodemus speciosus TaxID=105296 RepID=A0ABQ0FU91_APOSI
MNLEITESTRTKLDDFRKRLLGFIVGIMIIAFTFTCFCLLHYNCMVEEVQTPGGLNKENMAAISSWVSKVSACQPDMITEDILETQPLLLNSDQISGPSCPDKQPIPNSVAKSIQPSSLEKPCIPPNAQKSMKCINTEKSSTSCSVKHSNRQLESNRLTKSSSPSKLHKSSHLEKTYKKRSLKKSNKLTHACKLGNVNSSCSDKQVTPWLAVLQSSAKQATQSSSSISHKQIAPTRSCRIKKPNLSHGHYEVKKTVNRGKALLPKPPSAKTCRHYKDKCLVCNASGFLLNDLSGAEKKHAGNLHGSMKMKTRLEPFNDTGYKYKSYQKNASNDAMKIYDSEDSNAEIIIICDTSHDDITNKESFKY